MPVTFTQAQIDALVTAIASGTRRVKLGEKEMEYRSIADMRAALEMMQANVDADTRKVPRFQVASFSDPRE